MHTFCMTVLQLHQLTQQKHSHVPSLISSLATMRRVQNKKRKQLDAEEPPKRFRLTRKEQWDHPIFGGRGSRKCP